jgi:hypothetical protein
MSGDHHSNTLRHTGSEQRAIATVELFFGPLSGSGYTYVLKKGKGGWEVTGLIHSWIS